MRLSIKGKKCMDLQWVVIPKVVNGPPSTKSSIMCQGLPRTAKLQNKTCSRESLCLALAFIASFKWDLCSIDIRTTFLQGTQLERIIYICLPNEANTDQIWCLRKCIYGLADAPRHFSLCLHDELLARGVSLSQLDHGPYFWFQQDQLCGILICCVDDILFGGNSNFLSSVINPLGQVLQFGISHSTAFQYIGIALKQHTDKRITINQTNFANTIKKLDISPPYDKASPLNDQACSQFRKVHGKLNWLAGMCHPSLNFDLCCLATKANSATVADALALNKVVQAAQQEPTLHSHLNLNSIHLKVYTDGSFNYLPHGDSQGGQIIFPCNKDNQCSPLSWSSTKLRRVVCSALAAETVVTKNGNHP